MGIDSNPRQKSPIVFDQPVDGWRVEQVLAVEQVAPQTSSVRTNRQLQIKTRSLVACTDVSANQVTNARLGPKEIGKLKQDLHQRISVQ
jgi:hypothetical protein